MPSMLPFLYNPKPGFGVTDFGLVVESHFNFNDIENGLTKGCYKNSNEVF